MQLPKFTDFPKYFWHPNKYVQNVTCVIYRVYDIYSKQTKTVSNEVKDGSLITRGGDQVEFVGIIIFFHRDMGWSYS